MTIKKISFIISCLIFWLVNIIYIQFDPYINTFQYIYTIKYWNYYIYFGIDGITISFLLLTSFIIPICLLFAWNTNNYYINEYYICILSIEILLLLVFTVLDIFWFYIFFESILIPFFILIGLYGTRIRKIHAAYLLFFYTVCGSLFMLISIIYIYIHVGSTNIQILNKIQLDPITDKLLWFSLFLSFSIKVPIFPLHIWLPEAHVESPTEASVILASILLKVGLYGFIRFLIPMFPIITYYYSNLIILFNMIGIVYTSYVTIRQTDIKKIIAYSSIGHMNVCMLGILSFDLISIIGSLLLMIGHGFISSGLFFMVGILYERYKTKTINYYSGISYNMPIYSIYLFFFILSNISMPCTCNFIGELLILYKTTSEKQLFVTLTICISIFMCTAYSIWLYNKICFGRKKNSITNLTDLNYRELCILTPLVCMILLLGIYPNVLIELWLSNISYYYQFII